MKTIITFIGVAICTGLLYHLAFDEHSTLFYVNVVTTWVAEGILLLNLPILSNEKLLEFKNAASISILNIFAIVLFLWTTFYSLLAENKEDLDNLYIGMLAIGILFIIAFGATEIGGSAMKKQETQLKTTIQKKKKMCLSTSMYWQDAKDCLHFQSDWEDVTLAQFKTVLDKINSIPAEKAERNDDVMEDIDKRLQEMQTMFVNFSTNNQDERLKQSIERKISQLKSYVVSIKSTL